jgi:hypothetical protein
MIAKINAKCKKTVFELKRLFRVNEVNGEWAMVNGEWSIVNFPLSLFLERMIYHLPIVIMRLPGESTIKT